MIKIGYFVKLKEPHFFKSLNMNCNSIKKVTTGLIYLIQPALVLNSNVYKVGRTSKMNLERLNAYGRKSRLFLVLETKNPEELEKRILKKMNDFRLSTL